MDNNQRMNIRSLADMVAESSGLARVRLAAQLAALVKNAGVAVPIVSIYNNNIDADVDAGAPQDQGPGNEMTTEPTKQSRLERYEAEARALLAEGFITKAAQQRAKEFASRAFSEVKSSIQNVHLNGDRDNKAASDVYFGIPSYPHEWKPRHAAMIRADLPDAAIYIEDADRIVALAAEIKAAQILPKIANEKAAREREIVRIQSINPSLRAKFEAQAPAIAQDFSDYMRSIYARMQTVFPDGIPARVDQNSNNGKYSQNIQMLNRVCDVKTETGPSGIRGMSDQIRTLTLNEATLTRVSDEYGMESALEWFYKTNGKLGVLDNPELLKDSSGDVHVTGERGGQRIEIVQQRIINISPLGKAFNQFPSRIYVNRKFVTEAAYVDMWK